MLPVFMEGEEKNQFRNEIVEIANKVKPDYCINIVLTPNREVGDVYAGEMVKSHQKAAEAMKTYYQTSVVENADIVISNTYPFDSSFYFFSRGYWPMATGKLGSKKVLMVNGSMTQKLYNFKPLPIPLNKRFLWILRKLLIIVKAWNKPKLMWLRFKKYLFVSRPSYWLFCTGQVSKEELKKQFPRALIFDNWDRLLEQLQQNTSGNKDAVKVAIYPYTALQLSALKI